MSTLVVEVYTDAIDKDKMRKAIMLKGRYTGERTVKDSLSEEIFDMLKGFLEKNGIPMTNILKLKPGMLAMTLSSTQLTKLGFSPVHGIDAYFVKKAQGIKPVLELESMDEQLSLFFDMPDENLLLKYTILDLAKMKQQMNDLILAWNQGDLDGMNNLMLVVPLKEHPELLPIYQRLLFERNVKMAAKIRDLLMTKQTYFIVVGSGHLIGEKGIISLLEKARYDIRQVEGQTSAYSITPTPAPTRVPSPSG